MKMSWTRAASTGLLKEADGSENKERLGANAILAVSLASARAAASALKLRCTGIWEESADGPFQSP